MVFPDSRTNQENHDPKRWVWKTMRDPRDSRYYAIQKKARTTMQNLSPEELRDYLSYAEHMIEYVSAKAARKGWIARKKNILKLMEERD
jgi:hypothetical protein